MHSSEGFGVGLDALLVVADHVLGLEVEHHFLDPLLLLPLRLPLKLSDLVFKGHFLALQVGLENNIFFRHYPGRVLETLKAFSYREGQVRRAVLMVPMPSNWTQSDLATLRRQELLSVLHLSVTV
jgi:hypothetical protein